MLQEQLGWVVSFYDGGKEGTMVGASVGAPVGAYVGEPVGASVGKLQPQSWKSKLLNQSWNVALW